MGIDLRVESESGEVQDEILDDNNLTEKLLPEHDDATSPCLRYVDRDGDTVFNQLQLRSCCKSWRIGCARLASRSQESRHCVAESAQVGAESRSTYVRFSGE